MQAPIVLVSRESLWRAATTGITAGGARVGGEVSVAGLVGEAAVEETA